MQSAIPDLFKISIPTPIHKKINSDFIHNFRSISVISNVAKIFEKIIKNHLVLFLEGFNFLHQSQYGSSR